MRINSDRTQANLPTDVSRPFARALAKYEQGEFYLKKLLDIMLNSPSAPNVEHAVPAYIVSITGRITGYKEHFTTVHEVLAQFMASPALTPLVALVGNMGLGLIEAQRANVDGARAEEAGDTEGSIRQIARYI